MALPTDTSTNSGVAGAPYHMSLGGRPYMLDLSDRGGFVERTIPLLRNQADTSGSVSEESLNPEDLVRRAVDSCHGGAGQTYRDKPGADPFRFNTSEAIDVFDERYELSLCKLPEALGAGLSTRTATYPSNSLIYGSGRLYAISGDRQVRYATSPYAVWATATGNPAEDIMDWCSDGESIYIAYDNAAGIYVLPIGTGAMTALFDDPPGTYPNMIGFAKGRLLVGAADGALYNPTDFTTPPNALPTALLTLRNGTWHGVCGGLNHIYLAARVGDRSLVYKTSVKPDGTALDIPTEAARLPDGEQIYSIFDYLGYVFLSTNNGSEWGVRMCQSTGDGSLVLGPFIVASDANGSSFCFEAQGPYVYVGVTNMGGYDDVQASTEESGALVMDLRYFTQELAPAYARSFHISTSTNNEYIYGIASSGFTFGGGGGLYFLAASGSGAEVYETWDSRMAAGEIRFGKLTYGVPDEKVAMYLDIELTNETAGGGAGGGSVTPFVIADGVTTTFAAITASGTVDLSAISANELEVGLTLTRGASATDVITIKRVTLRSFVNANRTREWILPIILKPRVTQNSGGNTFLDVRTEVDAIASMVGTVVVLKVGTKTEYVQVKDYQWSPDYFDEESGQFGGTCLVKAQVVA